MASSAAFDWLCSELEQRTVLNRLEARGTVRLALKQAGLEPSNVTPDQMQVIATKVLPNELDARGIENVDALCSELAVHLASADLSDAAPKESPEAVFRRLGR